MNYKVSHPSKKVNCEIDLPFSKSISNRLLIIQQLCDTAFQIHNLSSSEDTISLQNALNSTNKTKDGMILVWDYDAESFIMTYIIDSSISVITGLVTFKNTTQIS